MSEELKFSGWKDIETLGVFALQQQEVSKGEESETWTRVERPPGIRMMVVSKDGQQILMTEEMREEHGQVDLRLPGGKVADSYRRWQEIKSGGEQAIIEATQSALISEGIEEAGIRPLEFTEIGISKCGSSVKWDLHVFMVTGYEAASGASGELLEQDIKVVWRTKDEVMQALLDGTIKEDRIYPYLLRWAQNNL